MVIGWIKTKVHLYVYRKNGKLRKCKTIDIVLLDVNCPVVLPAPQYYVLLPKILYIHLLDYSYDAVTMQCYGNRAF